MAPSGGVRGWGAAHRLSVGAWRRARWPALWLVGLAAGAWLLTLGLTHERTADHRVTAVLVTMVGWSFVASGLVAWRRRPSNRLGTLMVVLGLT